MFPPSDNRDIQSSANKHTGFSSISFNFQDELSTESMHFTTMKSWTGFSCSGKEATLTSHRFTWEGGEQS